MKTVTRLIAMTAVSSLAMAGAALADPPRPVSLGQTLTGVLGQGDARTSDNAFYEEFTVRLGANQSIEAVMASASVDAYLTVGRGSGEAFEELKSDDDSGGGEKGTDARVRFRAPKAGLYTVRAKALSEGMTGPYSLALTAYTPPPPAVAKPIAFGQRVTGRLANGGARIEDDDRLYDEYTFTAAAGDRIKIDAASTDFDALLDLGQIKDGDFTSIKTDDDSAGDKNPLILAQIETAGVYTVRVESFDKNGAGAYALGVTKLPPAAPAPRPQQVRVNLVTKGKFTDASPTFEEFRPYAYYVLSGRKGESVTITMRAGFDAYLDVGVMSPGGYAIIKSDDDGGGESNAKIDLTFESAGSVIIRASGYRPGSTGDYTVTVE